MGLADRIGKDEVVFSAWSGVPDALTVEVVAQQPGFDAVVLDMQHGGHNEDSVLRSMVPIQKVGKPGIVRIPVGRFDMASRALDFGAEAVIAPMVNSVADARAFAAAMKYPPLGERSWGPTYAFPRAGKDFPTWLAESNTRTLAIAMIETRAAVDVLDGILETPGIDGVFLGPADFSIAWTYGKEINPKLDAMMPTIEDVGRRARAAGKFCATYQVHLEVIGRYVEWGYRLICMGSEHTLIRAGTEAVVKAARESIAAKKA